ncbi:MAG: hypothetical protein KF768_10205 [Phycisphaeraceae bacterium]|nr:hypothetical protein [Phycisphaeraceae bacterium]
MSRIGQSTSPRPRFAAVSAAALSALAVLGPTSVCSAGDAPPVVVFSTFDSATNAISVPGVGTLTYNVWNGFTRSPNGDRWIFIAGLSGDATVTRGVIVGSGIDGSSAAIVAKRGDVIAEVPTRTINLPDRPRINDSGRFVFTTNTSGTGSPSLPVLTGVVGTPGLAMAAAIGTAIPGLDGANYSSTFSSLFQDNTGRFGVQCGITDSGGGPNPVVLFDNQIVARAGDAATQPTLIPGTGTELWSGFSLNRVMTDASGENFLWWGTTAGGKNVAAVNNVSVAQTGNALPSDPLGPNVQGFNSVWMESNGDWFVRGTFDDAVDAAQRTDFVLRNGEIIAKRGDPVVPGSPLTWDRVNATSTAQGFLFNVGNNQGDYVVAGNCIVDPDTGTRGAVVVLNGETIVMFRGDAIDVSGNGMADDDAFILGIKNEVGTAPAFLTDAGDLWMVIDVRNGAGTDIGDAIIRTRLDIGGALCPGDLNDDGVVDLADLLDFLGPWGENLGGAVPPGTNGDINGDGIVDLADLLDFLGDWSPNLGVTCP